MTDETVPEKFDPNVDDKFLTPIQVSERYGGQISKQTLANWRSSGEGGPSYMRMGNIILYKLSKLMEWEARGKSDAAQ